MGRCFPSSGHATVRPPPIFFFLLFVFFSSSPVLAITGRLFDTSKGLMVNDRFLTITEAIDSKIPLSSPSSSDTSAQEGTGVSTWDGSVVLAKYLQLHPCLVRNKAVIELGAGTGVSGMPE